MNFKKLLHIAIGTITINTQLYSMEPHLLDAFLVDLKQYLSHATIFTHNRGILFNRSENFFELVHKLYLEQKWNLKDCCKYVIMSLNALNYTITNFEIRQAKNIDSVLTEDDIFCAKIIMTIVDQSNLEDFYYYQIKGNYMHLSITIYEDRNQIIIPITLLIDKENFTMLANELKLFSQYELEKIVKNKFRAGNCIIQ